MIEKGAGMLAFAVSLFMMPMTDATQWELFSELGRFPPSPVASTVFWHERAVWLVKQMEMGGWRVDDACIDAWVSARLVHCWELLRQARDNPWHEPPLARLSYLKELRFLLGDEDYLMGRMPPVAPCRYFSRADR
jgi:hypothetical protein